MSSCFNVGTYRYLYTVEVYYLHCFETLQSYLHNIIHTNRHGNILDIYDVYDVCMHVCMLVCTYVCMYLCIIWLFEPIQSTFAHN